MEERIDTPEEFSLLKRAKSFAHAGRGVLLFIRTTHNAWLHVLALFVVVALGIYFSLSTLEWALIVLAAGFVFVAEAFNTAIEIDIDLTSPEYHPYARDTKDVAAGAVLLAALTALVIGLLVFMPHLVTLLN